MESPPTPLAESADFDNIEKRGGASASDGKLYDSPIQEDER
jgi:hypothetical protein